MKNNFTDRKAEVKTPVRVRESEAPQWTVVWGPGPKLKQKNLRRKPLKISLYTGRLIPYTLAVREPYGCRGPWLTAAVDRLREPWKALPRAAGPGKNTVTGPVDRTVGRGINSVDRSDTFTGQTGPCLKLIKPWKGFPRNVQSLKMAQQCRACNYLRVKNP